MLDWSMVRKRTVRMPMVMLAALTFLCFAGRPAAAAVRAKKPAYKAAKRNATHSTASKTASSRSTKGRRTARSRRYSPPKPRHYGPLAPTPERYQEIQKALADKGFFKGDVDGEWGPDSVNALRAFQQSQKLDPDGKIGSLSLIALGLGPKRVTAAKSGTPAENVPQPQ